MPTAAISPEEEAINLIAPRKLHQIFTLPATDKHPALKVTYAIAGPDIGENVPTILFLGGMFGTRYMAMWYDIFADRQRVRMLFIDRPAMGGSTPVPISQRISTVIETIPALLKHLNIPEIHLASHSAGTFYASNLLYYHPELLCRNNPTVHFFSPYVPPSVSSVSFLSAATKLPNSILNYWDSTILFAATKVIPTLTSSAGMMTSSLGSFQGSESKIEDGKKKEEKESLYLESYGFSMDVKREADKNNIKYISAESLKGGNDEARLCLKSAEGTHWDACEDYEVLIANLKDVWERRVQTGGKKLKVNVVFGEEDVMIGSKGRKYWEQCWTQEKCGAGIEVYCREVKGSDHETTIDATKGALNEMCTTVKATRD